MHEREQYKSINNFALYLDLPWVFNSKYVLININISILFLLAFYYFIFCSF